LVREPATSLKIIQNSFNLNGQRNTLRYFFRTLLRRLEL
jgi:hypothetical protein